MNCCSSVPYHVLRLGCFTIAFILNSMNFASPFPILQMEKVPYV